MSFQAIIWAMGQEVPGREKMTLLALADFSNNEGTSYPTMAKLAKKAGFCVRTTRMGLRKLEKLGLVTTHEQTRSYGRTSNFFVLAMNIKAESKKVLSFRPSVAMLAAPPAYYAAPPADHADITSNNNLTQDIQSRFNRKTTCTGLPS
jgi:hypothetical protein